MVTRVWGVRWFDSDRVTVMESEDAARWALAPWPGYGEVVSRWVRESPWRAESDA